MAMHVTRRPIPLLVAAALASCVLGATAARAVAVQYHLFGHLVPVGEDLLSLDGATLDIVVDADTSVAPDLVAPLPTVAIAQYFESAIATITDRPGGAPDRSFTYQTLLTTFNWRGASAGESDGFEINSYEDVLLDGVTIRMPDLTYFFAPDFYGDAGVPPLPVFEAADVVRVSFQGEHLRDAQTGVNLYHFVLPEPGSGLLLPLGLLALCRASRGTWRSS
jgi:hypothetical protein